MSHLNDYLAASLPLPQEERPGCWPEPFATWAGEYPSGRGQSRQVTGWQCPGCSRCYSPEMRSCEHCGPVTVQVITTATGPCCTENGCEEAER